MDGFLTWLHLLVLMNDIALMATNRENLINNMNQFCASHGMKIDMSKTIFFINGNNKDKETMHVSGSAFDYYSHLERPFTANGFITSAIKNKMRHALEVCIIYQQE